MGERLHAKRDTLRCAAVLHNRQARVDTTAPPGRHHPLGRATDSRLRDPSNRIRLAASAQELDDNPVAWILAVIALYAPCRWYMDLKRRSTFWLLGYV